MDNLYDVLVVGAGPAGLLAARSAAEHGLKVALLEKREDPTRLVRACAQTITAANEYYFGDLPAINRRDHRFSFPGNGFSFKYDGPSQNIYAWHFVTPDNHAIQFGDRVERRKLGDRGAVGIAFDKASMTRCLLEECRALSVEVFTGTKVTGIEASPGRVTLKTDRGAFEGAYCIACDGVNSVICEQMGYNREREYYCNLNAIMTYFEGARPEFSDIVLTTHGYIKGMAAMFYTVPRATEGDILTIVMSADPRLDMQEAQEYFFQRDWIKSWFVGAKANGHFSAVCNCYSPIVNPVRGRVVAVGDACSTQELEITGAMVSGWKAGQAMAVQIREESLGIAPQGLPRYAEWWKTTYGGTSDYETYMKSYALPYTLRSEAEINDMFAYIRGPLRACYNAYNPPLGDGIRPVRAKIMAERPDLMGKMALNRLPAKQLFAEMTKISKPV